MHISLTYLAKNLCGSAALRLCRFCRLHYVIDNTGPALKSGA